MKFTGILISLMFIVQSQSSLAQSEIDYLKSIDEQIVVQKAFDQVRGDCTITEKTIPVIGAVNKKVDLQTITRKEWTGTCINGFAEGEGRLSINVSKSDGGKQYFISDVWQLRGRMVHGKMRGPWLYEVWQSKSRKDDDFISYGFEGLYQWNDALFPGLYRRTAEGSFHQVVYTYNKETLKGEYVPRLDSPMIGSAMATQQMQAILDRASKKEGKLTAPVQMPVPMLVDLLPGGLVARSTDHFPNATHGKKVALILSTGTVGAFQRLTEFRKQLLAFAQLQSDDSLRELIENFANVADERIVSREIVAAVRHQFKSVKLVNDLPSFLDSDADYAIVIDFQFTHSVDKIIEDLSRIFKGKSIPHTNPVPKSQVEQALSYVLLNRALEVASSAFPKPIDVPGTNISGDRSTINFSLSSLEKMMEHTFGSKQHNAGSVPTFVLPIHYALRGQRY